MTPSDLPLTPDDKGAEHDDVPVSVVIVLETILKSCTLDFCDTTVAFGARGRLGLADDGLADAADTGSGLVDVVRGKEV